MKDVEVFKVESFIREIAYYQIQAVNPNCTVFSKTSNPLYHKRLIKTK